MSELSKTAKLADQVAHYMLFSGRFDDKRPSEIRTEYLMPIFGAEVVKELTGHYAVQVET